MLYTSGSTGKPKGVVIYEKSVFNIVTHYARELLVSQNSVVMALTTFCFDISVLEVFLPFVRGGTLVLAKSSTQKDPFRLLEVMEERKVNVFQATPTSYEMMLATGWDGDGGIDFLVGGEACRPSVLPVALNCRSLRNVYGPTETTIWSSTYTISPDFAKEVLTCIKQNTPPPFTPIGRPISQTTFYIVSLEHGEPSRSNAVQIEGTCSLESTTSSSSSSGSGEGELWIGGTGVSMGYLNAPHLTEKVFFPNPFGEGMVYRTGDVARLRPDGNYVFVRRLDDQVKIDGYRIELAEIEVVYSKLHGIDQAVAVVRSNKLVLYMKGEGSVELDLEMLHAQAKRHLPHYMIPKHTVIVHSFPHTANGKLDRKALPDPTSSLSAGGRSDQHLDTSNNSESERMGLLDTIDKSRHSLTNMKQQTISSVVQDVVEELRGKKPPLSATLAGLGVDSLGSVMLIRRLSDAFGGLRIKPSDVFAPGITIGKFATVLKERVIKEKPQIMDQFDMQADSRTLQDLESGNSDAREDDVTEVQGANEHEMLFDEKVAGNINLFEGCRGVLALLVLWEHYHDPKYEINFAVAADSGMFMIVAGLTVSLQFRILPVHVGRVDSGVRLLARKPFEALSFLSGKYLGIYPLLWFTLLLCVPNWYMNEPKHTDDSSCFPLWVAGLQVMSRGCVDNGPYGIWFASTLIIILFIYAVLRSLFGYVQDIIVSNRNKDFIVPYTNPNPATKERKNKAKSAKELVANAVTLMTYNRPTAFAATIMTSLFFMGSFLALYQAGFMRLKGYGITEKSPSSNLGFFFSGVTCAVLIECWHFALISCKSVEEVTVSLMQFLTGSQNGNAFFSLSDIRVLANDVGAIISLMWRFLPDAIVVVGILFCSSMGVLGSDEVAKFSMWITLPMLFLAFLFVSMMQTGVCRNNLSRYLLESEVLGMIGYSSLNLFLFQHIFIEFYSPWMGTGTIWYKKAKNGWFHKLPIYQRLFWVTLLIVFSYAAQYIVQEKLVLFLYSKVADYKKKYKSSIKQFQKKMSSFLMMEGKPKQGGDKQ